MALAVDARDLRHAYDGRPALGGVTLAVAAGERLGLLGRNGAGKTTLLRILSAQLRPAGGSVHVGGVDALRQPDVARHHLGVVFQSPALDGALTCREALALQAALSRVPRRDRRPRIDDALAGAGLMERAADRVATLSGGLARRLDLARALLHRPAVALLDEPTAGLDPLARDDFWAALDRRRGDGAQIVATHAMDEAARCDRVVILDDGRVVADGAPKALTTALGADALWIDTDDAPALAQALRAEGLDARPAGGRVLVPDADPARIAALYLRPDVRAVSVQPPTLADVFAASVGSASGTP